MECQGRWSDRCWGQYLWGRDWQGHRCFWIHWKGIYCKDYQRIWHSWHRKTRCSPYQKQTRRWFFQRLYLWLNPNPTISSTAITTPTAIPTCFVAPTHNNPKILSSPWNTEVPFQLNVDFRLSAQQWLKERSSNGKSKSVTLSMSEIRSFR